MISKRGLIAILVGTMLVGLTGCGASGNSTSGNSIKNDYVQMENSGAGQENSGSGLKTDEKDASGQSAGGKENSSASGSEQVVIVERKTPTSAIYSTSDGLVKKLEYDAQGRIVREYWSYVSEEEYLRVEVYTYDERGNLISKYNDYPDISEEDTEFVYTYDDKDRLIQTDQYFHSYSSDGERKDSTLFSSDAHTYVSDLQVEHTDALTGRVMWTELLDEYGNSLNNAIGAQFAYTYDEKGNITLYTETDVKGVQKMQKYEYDENGQLIKYYSNGSRSDIWTGYKYSNDFLVKEVDANDKGEEITRETYAYDQYGNMVLHTSYKEDGKTVRKEEKWVYTYE